MVLITDHVALLVQLEVSGLPPSLKTLKERAEFYSFIFSLIVVFAFSV